MALKTQVEGLNEFLTAVYGTQTRLSLLLADLGFNPQQVRRLHNEHLEHIVASFVKIIRDRMLAYVGGERMYLVLSRRFALDGNPPDTLQSLGFLLGVSRERVRQIEQKTLRRCQAKPQRLLWESGLQHIASTLVGEPQGRVAPLPLTRHQDRRRASEEEMTRKQTTLSEPMDQPGLDNLAEVIASILQATGGGLSYNILAHILAGSKGPITIALVAHYNLWQQYGSFKPTRQKEILRAIQVAHYTGRSNAVETQANNVDAINESAADLTSSVVAEMVASILQATGRGLTCSILAHILTGSKGPVVNALVTHYELPQYGALRNVGYEAIKQEIRAICATDSRIEMRKESVILKGA
jgi:Sigma-70, region 4